MLTEIYTDSRFAGLDAHFSSPNICAQVISGGGVKNVKRLLRARLNKPSAPTLFIVCVGINDIPECVHDLSEGRQEGIYSDIVYSFKKIRDYAHRINQANRVIIATVAPKDLRHSVQKYPHKADIELYRISTRHQGAYERFVCRLNDKFINNFNEDETSIHLALHTDLRLHRSRGRSSRFMYNKLYDGIHPCKSLKKSWFKKVERTVTAFHARHRH